jgi:pimeloyl-ACP methyl ester carboxylesterase
MRKPELRKYKIKNADIAVRLAGDTQKPALLLIHGFPGSSESFRNVIGSFTQNSFVIAPDLPGFGGSEPAERPSFSHFADIIQGVLKQLGVGSFHLYLHDYGAVVGLYLAIREPQTIRSLIIQNANAYQSGMGPQWAATRAYWQDPTPEHEAGATAHLTFEGLRYQYVGDIPPDLAAGINSRLWEEDWRIMSLPGRLDTQRALILDYRSHVARSVR